MQVIPRPLAAYTVRGSGIGGAERASGEFKGATNGAGALFVGV
jgi:hypothetical protein